jgi:hypothetical protein
MARGGKREGAGRPKGAVNKATADIREAAQAYTDRALAVLVDVMANGDSAAARVAAANAVLDRGHGKPRQSMDVDASLHTDFLPEVQVVLVRPGGNPAT